MTAPPTITLIAAYAANRAIGRDNALPWHLPADFAHFKRTTLGHPIVMGRKTWESLPRALPGRINVVVSRQAGYQAAGAQVVGSLAEALAACGEAPRIFVIGGAQLYAAALPLADEVIATEVHAEVAGDAFFPLLPDGLWREVSRAAAPPENGYAYDFVVYQRSDGRTEGRSDVPADAKNRHSASDVE